MCVCVRFCRCLERQLYKANVISNIFKQYDNNNTENNNAEPVYWLLSHESRTQSQIDKRQRSRRKGKEEKNLFLIRIVLKVKCWSKFCWLFPSSLSLSYSHWFSSASYSQMFSHLFAQLLANAIKTNRKMLIRLKAFFFSLFLLHVYVCVCRSRSIWARRWNLKRLLLPIVIAQWAQ